MLCLFILEHGQCEVKCDLKAGETADRTRFGLMPDGTPCSTPVTEDVFEKYNLPKSKGRLSRCPAGILLCKINPLVTNGLPHP